MGNNNKPLTWHRSSRCNNTTCVEVARDGDEYLIRGPEGILRFTRSEWDAFVAGVNADEFRF